MPLLVVYSVTKSCPSKNEAHFKCFYKLFEFIELQKGCAGGHKLLQAAFVIVV